MGQGTARRSRILRRAGWALLIPALLLVALVLSAALSFQARPAPLWIAILNAALALAFLAAWRRGPMAGFGLVAVVLGAFTLWWMTLQPSNDRDWQPDVAELLTARFDPADPSRVTLQNVRNFDWQTPTEATERWESRTYDLDDIASLDITLTYWAGPAIAHTMLSFGFADGEHIVFSLGIRPTRDESYSAVAGFFKAYELVLTGADERDAIRLRTSVQTGNRVVLYRIAAEPAMIRDLFVAYLDLANSLAAEPRFYRTILDNCTTIVWKLVDRLIPGLPIDYRVVVSGYLPGFLYDRGVLGGEHTLEELTTLGLLPAEVTFDGTGPGFSAAIRAGVPMLPGR
jgi:hypothetical protein